MAKLKTPSYQNVILTIMLGVMAWNAKTTYDLASHISGVDKEIIFNEKEHCQFKEALAFLKIENNKVDKKVLILEFKVDAIKHDDEIELIDE